MVRVVVVPPLERNTRARAQTIATIVLFTITEIVEVSQAVRKIEHGITPHIAWKTKFPVKGTEPGTHPRPHRVTAAGRMSDPCNIERKPLAMTDLPQK